MRTKKELAKTSTLFWPNKPIRYTPLSNWEIEYETLGCLLRNQGDVVSFMRVHKDGRVHVESEESEEQLQDAVEDL